MRLYLDSSAAAKLILLEEESEALAAYCGGPETQLVATDLLETELRRLALREASPQSDVTELLEGVDLYAIPRGSFHEAGLLDGPALRSLDALHLEGAIRLEVDGLLCYDARMSEAARGLGLVVHAPGAGPAQH